MGKSDSLQRLKSLGLNTPEFLIVRHGEGLKAFVKQTPAPLGFSVRSERGEEFRCPYFPGLAPKALFLKAEELIHQGYTLIVYPTIDTADCLVKGNGVRMAASQRTLFEYLPGPGNLRDVEQSRPQQRLLEDSELAAGQADAGILRVARDLRRHFRWPPMEIVEWSYYRLPVGRLQDQLIYWEIRPWQ